MFEQLDVAPEDPILGITEAFSRDPNPSKINLSVGVYKDANGKTPVLPSVKEAERRLLDAEPTKSYKPIHGAADYAATVQAMLFGADHEIVTSKRAITAHTPGGTGGLRVAADYLHKLHPGSAVWLPDPTWANHGAIFKTAGIETKSYAYFDKAANTVNIDAAIESLKQVAAGDVVLLHGCCQNPTGADPSVEQWNAIADVLAERGALPLIDFAYQGFADSLEEDAAGLRAMARPGAELSVCSSFSMNFGLYSERVGALTFVAGDEATAQTVLSQVKICIRTNYSNPPAHGAGIVTTILNDDALRSQWLGELAEMRDRINGMRQLLVDTLSAKGVPGDFSFIIQQRGMFSFSGLTKEQVGRLKDEYSIYIVGSGRINVAGITSANVDRLCEAISRVMAG